MRRALVCIVLAGCTAAQPPPAPDAAEREGLESGEPRLAVEYPPAGTTLGGPRTAFLAGRVAAGVERGERLDLVFAIDTSGSTCAAPAPAGDALGEECAAPGPGTGPRPGRVVDVEIAAAHALLARLDPELTRVGVVSFGAGAPIRRALHRFEGPDTGFLGTRLELAPTADFGEVERALDALAAREPDGATNIAGALARAGQGLLRPGAAPRKLVVLLTDGLPTAPRETPRENLVECLRAAGRAARHGIRVLSFAIGEAVDEPLAALEIAERTGGAFYPVRDASDLPAVFQIVQLDQIAELEVTNTTTREAAVHQRLGADGSWDAVVPVRSGANRIEIRARTEQGREVSRALELAYAPDAASPEPPAGLEARREAARGAELAALSSKGADLEREALARTRARLVEAIARERAAAVVGAAEARRELVLEVERPDVGAGPAR
jgi:hypothetical protein